VAWLVRDDQVLASLEVADTRRRRRKGLLGRDSFEGAMLLRPTRSVHTIGMRFPIDVAFCDHELRVLKVCTLRRWRVPLPTPGARAVIEAQAGAFEQWALRVGDELAVRGEGEQAASTEGAA